MTYRDRVSSRSGEMRNSGPFRGQRKRGDQIIFFTISEIAENLCVAKRTVHRWIHAGDLVVHRVGGVDAGPAERAAFEGRPRRHLGYDQKILPDDTDAIGYA